MFNSRKARILALAEQQKQQIARENQEQKNDEIKIIGFYRYLIEKL